MKKLKECYSFDDVLIEPRYSNILPKEVSIKTKLTNNIILNNPAGDAGELTVSDTGVVITGNLTVSGTTTTVNSTTVSIADAMLKLAKNQTNTADTVDFGVYGQFGDGSTFPQVVKDGTNLGGCTETVKYLQEQNQCKNICNCLTIC